MVLHKLFPLFTATLLACPMTVSAQTTQEPPMRTLLGENQKLSHGGWGAPTLAYTRLMDQDALLAGGRGGWLINHRFTIGLAAYGLVTNVTNANYDRYLLDTGTGLRSKSRFFMGYGGLLLEPVIAYRSPVHITLPLIIGAGGCGYNYNASLPDDFDPSTYQDDAQAFFVVEPGIALEMNVIPLVRMGVGVSYRYTSEVDLPATSKDALNGINAGLSIKVGRF